MNLLFQVAKEHGGIMRFIQVSCLGASVSSPSRMQRAKAAAEEAVLSALPEVSFQHTEHFCNYHRINFYSLLS